MKTLSILFAAAALSACAGPSVYCDGDWLTCQDRGTGTDARTATPTPAPTRVDPPAPAPAPAPSCSPSHGKSGGHKGRGR